MNIRVALIGCGDHSQIGHAVPLARYCAEHPGEVSLVAACDPRRERAELFCSTYGFAHAYSDLDAMLSSENPDVCVSVVPVELIPKIGIKLLRRGIPCVVEKPLGASIREVQELLDVARTTNSLNMVSVNRRFMPLLNRGIEWARTAGHLRYVRATLIRHERTEPEFLRFTAIHAMDTVRFIAGNLGSCDIRGLSRAGTAWHAIDIEFDRGIVGRVDVIPTGGMLEETYELVGDGFRAVITSPFGPQRIVRGYQRDRLVYEEGADKSPEDVIFGFYGEVVELTEALRERRRPRPSIEDIYPSVKTCFELADRVEGRPRQ